MRDILEALEIMRDMAKERNRFLQDVANLVVQAASMGLDHVDSAILLDVLKKHNDRVGELNEKIKVDIDANA